MKKANWGQRQCSALTFNAKRRSPVNANVLDEKPGYDDTRMPGCREEEWEKEQLEIPTRNVYANAWAQKHT